MKHRLTVVLFVVVATSLPSFARVLSYAPYSNRTSMSGFHERTSRHFVLIESVDESGAWEEQQLVLYDSTGVEEPRVVYPPNGGSAMIQAAALYERKALGASPLPMLLVQAYKPDGVHTLFSANGGMSWMDLDDLRYRYLNTTFESDFGGPDVQGMSNPIFTGTDAIPFIASYSGFGGRGIFVVAATGQVQQVVPNARVIGKDRKGSRLLIQTDDAIEIIDLNGAPGNHKKLAGTQPTGYYTGWITDNGSAYIQIRNGSSRFLFFHNGLRAKFILGPYDETPPALEGVWPHQPWQQQLSFFAVPTHDFEGAWLIQRRADRPTSLLRHTAQGGVQGMWQDISAPQVEALIPGASGDTVLVQVHRERSIEVQRPLLDPALAVWRVGDPMPRTYDELYLNEEWNKGFIHVDVDGMKAGAPFVFNSGSIEDDGEIITSPSVGGGGDVIQEWGAVRASLRQHLVLPGVARLHGAFASRWLTDVTIFNPENAAQTVDVRFVALGEEAVQAASVHQTTLTLQPREIRFIPDVLHALFSIGDGGGALHLVPATGMNVTGRTYSSKENGGTFGFGMQAIDVFNATGPRFPVTFAGAFPGQNFRTNILLTDTSGSGTFATLNAFGVSGPIGASTNSISAPAGGVLQYNALQSSLGLFAGESGGLIVQPTRGTAITTVVAIDNRTNDPTYYPPDLAATDLVRTIPVIGHVDGANGSRFRSDLYLFNPTGQVSTVSLEAKQWNSPERRLMQFSLLPNEARVIRDVLPTIFHMTGLARLNYWSGWADDGVRVTSRTYTIEDSGATYGSLIPPLNNFQIAGPGDRLEILGISGGSGFRTNLGLVELSNQNLAGEATVRIRILDQNMMELDTFTTKVARAGGMPINDIFGARSITPPEAAMIVVEVVNGGLIGAYATLVDNITNDSTYLGAQLGAQEN